MLQFKLALLKAPRIQQAVYCIMYSRPPIYFYVTDETNAFEYHVGSDLILRLKRLVKTNRLRRKHGAKKLSRTQPHWFHFHIGLASLKLMTKIIYVKIKL